MIESDTGWNKAIEDHYKDSNSDRRGLAVFWKIAEADETSSVGVDWTGDSASDVRLLLQEFSVDDPEARFVLDTLTVNNSENNSVTELSTGETGSVAEGRSLVVGAMAQRDDPSLASWTNGLSGAYFNADASMTLQTAWAADDTSGTKESTASWSGSTEGNAGLLVFSVLTNDPEPTLLVDNVSTVSNAVAALEIRNSAQESVFSVTHSGSMRLPALGFGTLQTDSEGQVTLSSDERLKNIFDTYQGGMTALRGIEPIEYEWNARSGLSQDRRNVGFSAQNIEEFIPSAVGTTSDGMLTLSDRPVLATVLNATKEQQEIFDALLGIGTSTATSTDGMLGEAAPDSLWGKLVELLSGFRDGVLTLAGIKTERVQTEELCVDDVCVTADDLQQLLNGQPTQTQTGGGTSAGSGSGGGGDTGADTAPTEETDTGTTTETESDASESDSDDAVDEDTSAGEEDSGEGNDANDSDQATESDSSAEESEDMAPEAEEEADAGDDGAEADSGDDSDVEDDE